MPRMKAIEPYATQLKQVERKLRDKAIGPKERTALNRFKNALYMLAYNREPQPAAIDELRAANAELELVRKRS